MVAIAEDGYSWAYQVKADRPVETPDRQIWRDEVSLIRWRALGLLTQLGIAPHGTILVFEPRTVRLVNALRVRGFMGTCEALLADRLPPYVSRRAGWDRTFIEPWPDYLAADSDLDHPPDESHLRREVRKTSPQCNVLIASNLLRLVPRRLVPALLQWLITHITPRGYLLWSEPESPTFIQHMEQQMIEAGAVMAVEPDHVEDGWPRTLATFQVRGRSESRLTGVLRGVSRPELENTPSLRQELAVAYREGFGGDEWHEWMRCVNPDCGRRYSRREADALGKSGHCVCGWPEPLEPFYSTAMVVEKVYAELAEDMYSCCYIRKAETGGIGAFSWGYHTSADTLAGVLAWQSGSTSLEQEIRRRILEWLAESGLGGCNDLIYYHSEEAVLEGTRSLTLTRALFHRALQLAADRGAHVVILRTSTHSSAYALLIGVGMKVVYRYHRSDDTLPAAPHAPDGDEQDKRVVLGGDLRQILGLLSQESDRQIAVRIAHHLKRERGGGIE